MSISKLLSTNVLKAHVYMCLFKVLATNVFQSSYLHVFVSKLLSTNVLQSSCLLMCLKVHVCLCLHQNSCLLMYLSKLLSTSVCLHEFWKELLSFEVHHKHGLLYHIVFAKMYQRL
jgi:hypothetical protein